ncbi:DUF899 domain-containing protein [Phycicoccus sp. CSK15P-2]|uniref:DUF899 domain-containing protein n=1 Tax=Phycicoccus sp. CSK15P-2 TaxID=2807627 RepID=UPI0019506FB0|nr:DUF899 domain-containing protein [Phycicoccus sp. CSK15P-2]MBM6405607.1 DUF899 domain-containing protein [Phycicoccus sp. CSK15P-2]
MNRVITRTEWVAERQELLDLEKEATRLRDEVSARRREMGVVRVEKDYRFVGPDGETTLLGLFEGRRQLIVRHFMFQPEWSEGCIGCSMQADSVGHLAHMNARDTTFVMTSRAEQDRLTAFADRMGWDIPWFTTVGDVFNRDYGVTTDEGDIPGVSVFIRDGEDVYYTYSVFDRGGDIFKNFYNYLDLTPMGRQEEQLDHPWDWWRHHDRYEDAEAPTAGQNFWNTIEKFDRETA